jgi:hypothetical protein
MPSRGLNCTAAQGYLDLLDVEAGKWRRQWVRVQAGQIAHFGMRLRPEFLCSGWLKYGSFAAPGDGG